MYIFKLRPADTDYHDIDIDTIELKTEKKMPYYRARTQSNEISHFAVCPACNNPVQIIGLYTIQKPYARHYKGDIPNLVGYIQENYDFCPLKKKHQTYTQDARKTNIDISVLSIIKVLVEHFDKVIYFTQKNIGIFISDSLAQSMIRYYFKSKGYLYPGSTLLNVPLMFAYFSGTYHLNGRIVFSESLKKELIRKNVATFTDKKLQTTMDVSFCFRNHSIELIESHNLEEKLVFSVATKDEKGNIRNIYKQDIKFDPVYSRRLLNYKSNTETEEQKQRSKNLRDSALLIAQEFGFMKDYNEY